MAERRSGTRKWWLLVLGLAIAHFVFLMLGERMLNPVFHYKISRSQLEPPWLYYAFIYVFAFPATLIFWITKPGPKDGVFGWSILMSTFILWGCIWAEPIRRKYGWQPWRLTRHDFQFSLRSVLVAITILAVIFGTIGYIRVNLPQWQKDAAQRRAERARLEAEYDRIQKADMAAGQELIQDLDAIRDKLGRYPNDEDELVRLRGKPMPLLHPRDKLPRSEVVLI